MQNYPTYLNKMHARQLFTNKTYINNILLFSLVCTCLKPKILQKNYLDLDNNFKVYTRAILTLATSVHRARDMRNLFVDIAQILDSWKQNGWNVQDLESFLHSYMQCALEMDVLR